MLYYLSNGGPEEALLQIEKKYLNNIVKTYKNPEEHTRDLGVQGFSNKNGETWTQPLKALTSYPLYTSYYNLSSDWIILSIKPSWKYYIPKFNYLYLFICLQKPKEEGWINSS